MAGKGSLFLVCSTSQLFSRIILDTLVACMLSRQIVKQSTGTVTMGWKTWRHGDPHAQNYAVCSDDLARINMIYHFYAPGYVEYSLINKMAKYDWNTFLNYVAFLAGAVAPGTRCPHHDSELISCYHDAFRTWGHYHNNIVLFYHDSPITRSHFMDPTDRAIKGFYCTAVSVLHIFQTTDRTSCPGKEKWMGNES